MSEHSWVRVSAPGKVMLCGEYAVLRGAPALLVAVDRRVEVAVRRAPRWSAWSDLTPEETWSGELPPDRASSALLNALAGLEWVDGPVAMEARSNSFRDGATKLGLGSSAAVAAAGTVAMAHLAGHGSAETGADVAAAIGVHDRLQGRPGSGADVACSLTGGWVAFRRSPLELLPIQAAAIHIDFIWTGEAASTTNFIAGFNRWAESPGTSELLDELRHAAVVAADRWASDAVSALTALDAFADLTAELGRAANLPIHGGSHAALRALGREYGVVYKPCGAGGGDFGVALCQAREPLDAFAGVIGAHGCRRLALGVDASGCRIMGL